MKDKGYKFYLEAEIKPLKETVALKKEVASVLDLPDKKNKQPDLDYFSSVFVSSGTNLNNAHFLPSELVMAENSISAKAVDVEHVEDDIIGHIYDYAFTDKEGKRLVLSELQNKEIASLNKEDIHIEIASVVYKTRFPEIAQEVRSKNFKVSMEAYYQSHDIKIGNTIMTTDEAQALGFDVANDELYGALAKVVKAGEIVDEGKIARVLRGICFSGVGIVKNPANPPSVILETASDEQEVFIFNYDDLNNKVTSSNIDSNKKDLDKEEADAGDKNYPVTVGVCVNYHKELLDSTIKSQDSTVIETNWCSKFDSQCPTAGNAKEPECLINTVRTAVSTIIEGRFNEFNKGNKIEDLTIKLVKILKRD